MRYLPIRAGWAGVSPAVPSCLGPPRPESIARHPTPRARVAPREGFGRANDKRAVPPPVSGSPLQWPATRAAAPSERARAARPRSSRSAVSSRPLVRPRSGRRAWQSRNAAGKDCWRWQDRACDPLRAGTGPPPTGIIMMANFLGGKEASPAAPLSHREGVGRLDVSSGGDVPGCPMRARSS